MAVGRLLRASGMVLCLGLLACRPTPTASVASLPTTPATVLTVSGSGTALPIVRKLAETYRASHPDVSFTFQAGANSGGAIRGVTQNTLDIAVTNRPLSQAESAERIRSQPFARDAVAFVSRDQTAVSGLATDQIRRIYGGEATNWSQVGGINAPIVVLDRDEDESMRKLVLLPLLNGRAIEARPVVLTSAADMLNALQSAPNPIGYTSLGLLRIEQPNHLRALALDSVLPSAATVESGAYPWSMTYALVLHADAPVAAVRFVEFVLSPAGQAVLAQFGYGSPGV